LIPGPALLPHPARAPRQFSPPFRTLGHQSPPRRLAPSLVTLRARPPGCPAWTVRGSRSWAAPPRPPVRGRGRRDRRSWAGPARRPGGVPVLQL